MQLQFVTNHVIELQNINRVASNYFKKNWREVSNNNFNIHHDNLISAVDNLTLKRECGVYGIIFINDF